MTILQNYFKAFKLYCHLGGRATRAEFWSFILINALVTYGLFALAAYTTNLGVIIIYYVYTIVSWLPSIGVTVRRLHDTNRSGWMIIGYSLVMLIPMIVMIAGFSLQKTTLGILGALGLLAVVIYYIYVLAKKGDAGKNRFDDYPSHPWRDALLLIGIIFVLPIVLVLLVGGFAGYQQAADRYQMHKQMEKALSEQQIEHADVSEQIDANASMIKAQFRQLPASQQQAALDSMEQGLRYLESQGQGNSDSANQMKQMIGILQEVISE